MTEKELEDESQMDLGDWLEFNCYEKDHLEIHKEYIRGKLSYFTLKNVRTGDSCIVPYMYSEEKSQKRKKSLQ